MGFQVLGEEPGRVLVLGLLVRLWSQGQFLNRVPFQNPAAFVACDQARSLKLAFDVGVDPLPDGTTLLHTETRVKCRDALAWRLFAGYWMIIRPFSGLIRNGMLHGIRQCSMCKQR